MNTDALANAFRSIPSLESPEVHSAEKGDLIGAAETFSIVLRKLAVQQMRDSREMIATIQQSLGKVEQTYDAWQREQQRATTSERQSRELAEILINMLDLLERMATSFDKLDGMEEWSRQTAKAIQSCLLEAGKVGLSSLGTPGEPFDEDIHDVGHSGLPRDAGPWVVYSVSARGYSLNGQILRRAQVEL